MQNTKKNLIQIILGIRLRLICLLAAAVWISYGCGKDETAYFLEETAQKAQELPVTAAEAADGESLPGTDGNGGVQDAGGMPEEETEAAAGAQAAESSAEKAVCFIHICGAVEQPGVYELAEGSRVFEAVELAGGLTEDACGEYLNQAQEITDGMKIYIPTKEQVGNGDADGSPEAVFGISEGKSADSGGNSSAEKDGLVNINTADKNGLMTLPGIGESRAESIIAYRQENGSFAEIEDIMQVSGIKEGAYQKLKDKICVR